MSFTVQNWQDEANAQFGKIGAWVERAKREAGPYLLYGGLCGLSLWPLVEAAQKGQMLDVMMALGTVASGVGGNLLANQVQQWKDKADLPRVADWVSEQAPANKELRAALDAILAQLKAIPQAQATLAEADRAWFERTLRQEMAQLGSLPRLEAQLTGSGAIAQGPGAVAAGKGGVAVGGSVYGSIVTGSHISGDMVEGDKVLGDKIARQINTGGGAYVARDVNTLGGDFVGRDKLSFSSRQVESADDARPRLSTEAQKLAALLEEYFDNEDLQVVCQQLRLDWNNLGKAGKRAGLASLVGQCERAGQTAQLKAIVRLARPQLKRQLL